jgi:hypothetical protein
MSKAARSIGGAAQGAATGMAFGGPVGAAIGGGLSLLGGLFGPGESAEEKAAKELQAAYGDLIIASPEERRIQLEYLKSIGELTPEMEQAIEQEATAYEQIQLDPNLKKAQMEALARLERQGREGLVLEDRAALEDIRRQEAQALRGQQEAILQNMQQRGMGGAGAELAAQLQASQSSADRASQRGLDIAAQAQRRALEAVLSRSNLAGQMESQDFSRQAQQASAKDAISRFNTANRQDVQMRNVGSRNRAQESDLDYRRRIDAANTDTKNRQAAIDRDATLGYYDARNEQKLGKAGAGVQVGRAKDSSEARATSNYLGALGGAGALASSVAGMQDPTKILAKSKAEDELKAKGLKQNSLGFWRPE